VEGNAHAILEDTTHVTFDGYLTDRMGEKAVAFIDRNKDQPFFIYWAPNAVHTPMEASGEDLARFEGHPRQTLAAMTWALDRAVGNIVDKLESEDLLDNTLIFFLSDNGGSPENTSINLPLKGFKGNKFEGGQRVAFFAAWVSQIQKGEVFHGLTSSLDIFATAADVAGVTRVDELALDGVSLMPFLKGEKSGEPHQALFWRKDKMAAARVGNYKMIRVENLASVFYNLENDLGETQNLVQNDPQGFESVKARLEKWEEGLMKPLWTEGQTWDTITWMIHQDLMNNREVRVKNPGQLNKFRSTE
jgi:arylsulfatase A-like enzyme